MNTEISIKKYGEAPHEPVVGTFIALTVVSIIMNALFYHVWFAVIPQIVLLIHLIKNIVEYIRNEEARKSYPYHTDIDDVAKIWIATIIISIIMRAIFHGMWVGQIAPAVLRIKAIEITILYFVTLNRQKQSTQARAPTTVYIQPEAYITPEVTVRVKTPDTTLYGNPAQSATSQPEIQYRYCHICGEKVNAEMNFCAYCGSNLNR